MADDGDPELLELLGVDTITHAIETYIRENDPDRVLDLVRWEFDVGGEQELVDAKPTGVHKARIADGQLIVRVEFSVTYKNPGDEEDRELSAENVTEVPVDLRIDVVDLEFGAGDISPGGNAAFPR